MKLLLVLCLSAVVSAQRFTQIHEKLFNSDANPCGSGNRPTSCTCPNGSTFTPGSRDRTGRGPCGDCVLPNTCTCPGGRDVQVPSKSEIKQKLISRVLNNPKNPCGPGLSPSCTCEDGSTFTPGQQERQCGAGPSPPCSSGRPSSCTCPNGSAINLRQLRNLFKDLLAN